MFETLLVYVEGGGYQLSTVLDGFLEELLDDRLPTVTPSCDGPWSEQSDVHAVVAQLEVVLQYTIVSRSCT